MTATEFPMIPDGFEDIGEGVLDSADLGLQVWAHDHSPLFSLLDIETRDADGFCTVLCMSDDFRVMVDRIGISVAADAKVSPSLYGYLGEFAEFAPGLDITPPDGFIDTSWHNDSAPSFERILGRVHLRLWVQHKDETMREFGPEHAGRFMVQAVDPEHSEGPMLYDGNDYVEACAVISRFATACEF